MNRFKKGDKVIRVGDSFGDVKHGTSYTVEEANPLELKLEGIYGTWLTSKFKLAEVEDQV